MRKRGIFAAFLVVGFVVGWGVLTLYSPHHATYAIGLQKAGRHPRSRLKGRRGHTAGTLKLSREYPHVREVLYNRLPKCGSTSLKALTRRLAKKNHFHFKESNIWDQFQLNQTGLKAFAEDFYTVPSPFIYERHVYFVDFEQLGLKSPKYINLVRDPLDRIVSSFHFMRYGRKGGPNHIVTRLFNKYHNETDRNQTFDSCVLNRSKECWGPRVNLMTHFFCGQDPVCRDPESIKALDKAKENIRRHYLVVGLLEDFNGFLKVLSKILPQFYRGVTDLWKDLAPNVQEAQKTVRKQPPSPLAQKLMQQRMYMDYELYTFIQDRFHRQKLELGIH
ncbi:uronyl 2-sulfotransferase-like isoform X1 [Branchiostoma floridae x Branchiostoma belcheri]